MRLGSKAPVIDTRAPVGHIDDGSAARTLQKRADSKKLMECRWKRSSYCNPIVEYCFEAAIRDHSFHYFWWSVYTLSGIEL